MSLINIIIVINIIRFNYVPSLSHKRRIPMCEKFCHDSFRIAYDVEKGGYTDLLHIIISDYINTLYWMLPAQRLNSI